MKFIFGSIIIIIAGYFASLYLPWWSAMAVAALVGFIINCSSSFLMGFMSLSILWGVSSLLIDMENNSILSSKIGALFQVGGIGILLITTLLAGILGGLSAWSGALGRRLFHTEEIQLTINQS